MFMDQRKPYENLIIFNVLEIFKGILAKYPDSVGNFISAIMKP